MRRLAVAVLVATVLTAACSEQKLEQATAPAGLTSLANSTAEEDSLRIAELIQGSTDIIQGLFGTWPDCSGNCNAAMVKFEHIADELSPSTQPYDSASAVSHTYDLIGYVLSKWREGTLNDPPGAAGVTELINLLFKYAGIDATICDFAADCNATLYQPGSPAQILTTPSGLAGVSLPEGTGTVTEPTVITVSLNPNQLDPLLTELDQYPYFYLYTSSSGQGMSPGNPFRTPVTVQVCLENVPDQPVLGRLALAHNVVEPGPTNIQILQSAAAFLPSACIPQVGAAGTSFYGNLAVRSWRLLTGRLATVFTPQPLQAAVVAVGTGTGTVGTTKTFSPFGAVDPEGDMTVNSPSTLHQSLPEGSTFTAPSVKLTTPLGSPMSGIPVTFTQTGTGSVSPATVTTGPDGVASATTWNVPTGTSTVTAEPAIPCSAPVDTPNCGYISPASLTFTATANPPTKLEFGVQPTTTMAGNPFNVTVKVEDKDGKQVPAYSGPVTLALTPSTANGAVLYQGTTAQPITVSASSGLATFSNLSIQKAGTGYTLTASATLSNGATTVPSNSFNVTAASAALIGINAGNNQTAAEGSTLGTTAGTIAPSVKVTDTYGNVVGGAGVTFAVASGAGSVGSQPTTTSSLGIASTTWTIVAGTNTLDAYITALGRTASLPVPFTATGTSVSKELLSCSPASGSGDELTKALYWTPKGGDKTFKQVTLYLASNDPANVPTPFTITLKATSNGFGGAVLATSTQTPTLRGSSSQNLATNFTFPNVSLPSGSDKKVYFQFVYTPNPNGVKLTFAKSATTCDAITKTSGPTSTTSIGKGVGIKILGS